VTGGDQVVGYIRVSTDKQGERGVGMETQEQAIRAECDRHGWQLLRIETDVLSGKSMKRPGLHRALGAVRSGESSGIVVAKLDRLSRSVIDFAELLKEALADGWNIVALDFGVDLSKPNGKLVAGILIQVAEWEREIIGERTRAGMAVVKQRTPAERKRLDKKVIGRPQVIAPPVRRRIRGLRTRGHSYQAIADLLNREGVPTGRGGQRWYAMVVRHVADDYDKTATPKRRKRAV
jgi:DNA invertase Pin-like site-specific DNA recombinase